MDDIQHLIRPDGERLAFRAVSGAGPTVLWIGGFRSDMEGTKALALDAAARGRGWAFVRYDHFAHGASSGDWWAATIGRWREDALALIDHIGGPVVPVGSSMGGWIALLAALARPEAVRGLVLINPAQDFTDRLMWPSLTEAQRREIETAGETMIRDPGQGSGLGDHPLTRRMFQEARGWMLMDAPVSTGAPIHILQGRRDDTVPLDHTLALVRLIRGAEVRLDVVAHGDHRLSRPQDLTRLVEAVEAMRR